jgi:hypothetical protein
VAYSNNVAGALTTTLYAIDSVSGNLGIISVPNNGGPINNVGSLGLGTNLSSGIAFDISGLSGNASVSLMTGGLSRLYSINLATGSASLVGTIGTGSVNYTGLTAATAIPEPSTVILLAAAAGAFGIYRRFRRAKS